METALLVIDVQTGAFTIEEPIYKGTELLNSISRLLEKARTSAVPIIYIQHNGGKRHPFETGTEGWEIHPRIKPKRGDIVIRKEEPDSFQNTILCEEL